MNGASTTLDLAELSTPVVVIGGICGNLQALEAFLDVFDARHFGSTLICTGDIVAYFADPGPCVDLLRARDCRVIAGNCEQSLAAGSGDCGCGFNRGSACDLLKDRWYAYCRAGLDEEQLDWMAALPRHLAFIMAGRSVKVVHGAPGAVNGYVFPSSDDAVFREEFAVAGTDVVIAGHSGVPFTRYTSRANGAAVDGPHDGSCIWHNSGSLGMPANDGTPRVWYSELTPGDHGIVFRHYALDYPHPAAAAKVIGAGLPGAYAHALTFGLWPGDDVMPDADRRRRGRALDERRLNLT